MRSISLLLLSAAALTVGPALAAEISTDYNHSTNFSRFHTYSWVKVETENPLWQDRIVKSIEAQLAAKGLTKVAEGGDIGIVALGTTQTQQTLRTFYDNFGGGWYWNGFGSGIATTTVEYTPIGTLVVDLFDGNTKKLVWRGTASETLSHKPEKNEKKLQKVVAKMFEHFPPASKG